MSWKAPYRPDNKITQFFLDGLVTIFSVKDAALPGYQPQPSLTETYRLRYEEQRLGLRRYYEAKQNQIQVERVIRVPRVSGITSQDVAETEDGRRYRIDLVQAEDTYPPSLDLTLTKYVQEPGEVSADDLV